MGELINSACFSPQTETTVYIVDKTENNPATIAGHPACESPRTIRSGFRVEPEHNFSVFRVKHSGALAHRILRGDCVWRRERRW